MNTGCVNAKTTEDKKIHLCKRCKTIKLKITLVLDNIQSTLQAVANNKEIIKWISDLGALNDRPNASSCSLCKVLLQVPRPGHYGGGSYPKDETYFLAISLGRYYLMHDIKLRIMRIPGKDEDVPWSTAGPIPDPHPDLGQICPTNGVFCLSSPNDDQKLQVGKVGESWDLPLLKRWLQECRVGHSCGLTYPLAKGELTVPSSVIDCISQKLVRYTASEDYIALSYVWGQEIMKNGSLADPPRTIKDAICVTRALGLRYLWVDRYCITASHKDTAYGQIKRMDEVYGKALLTIVALGDNPSVGLPGVNGKLRNFQPSFRVRNEDFRFTFGNPSCLIGQSKWAQRAWTFQEEFLSRRIVYFGEDQMYFNCLQMDRCEVFPISNPWVQDAQRRTRRRDLDVDTIWRHIQEYSKRELTKHSDILNAFLGIFHYYQTSSTIRHYWGIPFNTNKPVGNDELINLPDGVDQGRVNIKDFLSGLQWQKSKESFRRLGFPSWSWTGWQGGYIGNTDTTNPGQFGQDIGRRDIGHVWIERIDGTLTTLDELRGSEGFDFIPSSLTHFIHLDSWVTQLVFLPREDTSFDGERFAIAFQTVDGGYVQLDSERVDLTSSFSWSNPLRYFAVLLVNPALAVANSAVYPIIIHDLGFEGSLGSKPLSEFSSERVGSMIIYSTEIEEAASEPKDSDGEKLAGSDISRMSTKSLAPSKTKQKYLVTDELLSVCWERQFFRLQ
ncbi:HET-domain-containing protein [Microthyrium microscopicum]|uniref:HET-domain-containing protein n=1 Tax=Microthyrium microscopicum TaxID=703497 RepID=A0A6A6UHD9_9PEZI|nr:HET-domain-containing protein [Microthyrium microscopicum]